MILSMTGFGTGEASRPGALVRVEVRSTNHRYFEPSIRVSRSFASWENRVREIVGARVARGRVTVNVEVESDAPGSAVILDERMAGEYARLIQFLRDRFEVSGAVDPVAFAQLPDLLRRDGNAAGEVSEEVLVEALGAALDELDGMRRAEGSALAKDLEARVHKIEATLSELERIAQDAPDRFRRRLEEKIATLVPPGLIPDAERLAVEVALLAEKADIVEEIVRFRAHDQAFLGFLRRREPVGKRLDFLLQEMNREANTIGSKAVNAEVSHRVVEIKEEIERLREQVQNIE